jgi:alkylated DNA repair dioxygenase AlkB
LTLFAPPPPGLFATPGGLPEGFRYRAGLISPAEEAALVAHFRGLDFRAYEFHGYLGKRRIVSFGTQYDDDGSSLNRAGAMPDFLLPLRAAAAGFAGVAPDDLRHALVTEYAPGAAIGWHRDRPGFRDIVGVSFLSPCHFRFRRRQGGGWERTTVTLERRSAYLLRGPARQLWQHSIPPAEQLRYSVTFRSLR